MPTPAIICPQCGRARVGHDCYACWCGQRFRLARRRKVSFLAETEADSLFWVSAAEGYLNVNQVLALPELEGVDPGATFFELSADRIRTAAELALARGEELARWRGRPH